LSLMWRVEDPRNVRWPFENTRIEQTGSEGPGTLEKVFE
jgi:hypothetical protein